MPRLSLALGLLLLAACSTTSVIDADPSLAPGSKALLGDSVTCNADADCATGEQCVSGVCQIQRCAASATYHSSSPFGTRALLAADRELAVLDGTRGIDGYEPTSGSFAHPSTLHLDFGGASLVDEAGGRFTSDRAEGVAVAIAGTRAVVVTHGASQTIEIPLDFAPLAVAAGDVEGDGTDEVVALSTAGDVAVCTVATKGCTKLAASGTAKDVTVADVDGDGNAEVVVLADESGSSHLLVFNLDTQATGDRAQIDVDTKHTAFRVSAGQLDRGAAAEIVLLEDGGYLGFASDVVRVFGAKDDTYAELGSASAAASTSDILAGDIDGDQQAEILVLEGGSVEVFGATTPTSPTSSFTTPLTASVAPTRLALADLDGDSPVGTLSGDPELVAGPVVPVSVLVYPPYSATHSDGTSVITVGNTESKDQSSSTTVTLNASAMVGYEFGISGIAKASVHGLYGQGWGTTRTHVSSVSIGDNFSVKARPEVEGPDNGVAVLACACFHAYTYQIDDPAGKLGDTSANGKKMSVFVPVGGQTALWSLKRYNALAAKLGSLPVVNVPYTVGDPTSYPAKMQTLAGRAIPAEDLLYTTPKSYRTSDVANVGWTLGTSESNAQAETASTTLGLRAKMKAGPVEVELNASETSSSTLSVNVGKSATFSGTVPPIRNLAQTPEDENALYSFGFSPVVYREHYTAADGSTGGLYVVTYAVNP